MTKPMITPIFFPFSHIRKDQLKCITAFFSKIAFLPLVPDFNADQKLAQLTAQGILHPLFSSAQELDRVKAQVRSYQDWAQLHRGNEKNLRALLQESPYFADDTGLSSIQSQIRRGTKEKKSGDHEKKIPDPLLVLKFAEILDAQNEGIEEELAALELNNASLFSQLLGEAGEIKSDSYSSPCVSSDPGSIMTEGRVVSWLRYSEAKGIFKGEGGTALLVTTSSAVFDFMVSKCEGAINGLDIDSIKVHENECENRCKWQQDFDCCLEKTIANEKSSEMAQLEADDTCSLTGKIKLCLLPGEVSKAFLKIPGQSIAVCLVQLKS
jgi:hypothetical protein